MFGCNKLSKIGKLACTKNYDLSSSLELSQFLKNAANALNDALNDI